MGTRADFYLEENDKWNWLGSVEYDGYDAGDVPKAKTRHQFLSSLKEYAESCDECGGGNKFIYPERGWPWPWENSHTTDYAYVFMKDKKDGEKGKVHIFNFGRLQDKNGKSVSEEEDPRFPNFSTDNPTLQGVCLLGSMG